MIFRFPSLPYKCVALGVDVQRDNMQISAITGYHYYLKSNVNVQKVEFNKQWWCSYLPDGFSNFFPNLLEFEVLETPLKALRRSNFNNMTKLVTLCLDDTKITSLPEDTFTDLVSLEELSIRRSFLASLHFHAAQKVAII